MLPGFEDGKDPQALRTIGEVARALNIRQHVLRYWEDQFPMLRPIKRSGGRRYYRAEDIALIIRIDGMVHREGYTLRGARQVIGEGAANKESLPRVIPAPASTTSSGLVESLTRIRADLSLALEQA